MSDKHEPSLLEYARFHKIASDFTAAKPSSYLNRAVEVPLESPSLPEDRLKALDEYLSSTQQSLEKTLREEKLNVRKDDARFLSAVIRDAKAQAIEHNHGDHIMAYRRINQLKLELPIFSLEYEASSALPQGPVNDNTDEEDLSPLEEALDFRPDTLEKKADEIYAAIRHEKINCSKQSLVLLQDVMNFGNLPSNHLGSLLDNPPQTIYRVRTNSPPLAPMGTDDEVYRSPSPEPELQMLPSPASTELLEKSKYRSSPSKPSNISYEPQGHDCMRRTAILEPNCVVKSDHNQTTNERQNGPSWQEAGITGAESHISTPLPGEVQEAEEASETRVEVNSEASRTVEQYSSEDLIECLSQTAETTTMEGKGVSLAETASIDKDLAGTASSQSHPSHSEGRQNGLERSVEPTEPSAHSPDYEQQDIAGGQMTESATQCYHYTSEQTASGRKLPAKTQQSKGSQPQASDTIRTVKNDIRFEAGDFRIADKQPLQQRKRKRQDIRRLSRENRTNPREPTSHDQERELAIPSFTSLGSLDAFMEIRGRKGKRVEKTQSPYFPGKGPAENAPKRHCAQSNEGPARHTEEPEEIDNEPYNGSAAQFPRFQKSTGERHILFLSIALLKSHLRLVRSLESMAEPPIIIYREYNHHNPSGQTKTKHITAQSGNHSTLQTEADIIISPSTGIILTTSQATTQLYLPGHKFSHPQLNDIAGIINSPLRERIFLLAPRYERIYVFICHSPKTQAKQPSLTADKRVLASIASLTAFCNSMSAYATICPLLIPSSPEAVAGWVLSLATKHAVRFPTGTASSAHGTGFTPINQAQKDRLRPEMFERTSVWELFLRRAGLNPYAAQSILAVLGREYEREMAFLRCMNDGNHTVCDSAEKGGGKGLSRFIEMTPEQRRLLFGELIGERMLGRINHVIDKDWQCDWALNFDVDAEL